MGIFGDERTLAELMGAMMKILSAELGVHLFADMWSKHICHLL